MQTAMPDRQHKKNIFSYADFNLASLLRLAKQLRRQSCSCDESQRPMAGAMNWAILLQFDDGTEWVFRSMITKYAVKSSTAQHLLASEAATLKYVRQNTDIPVPQVFSYCTTSHNEIGIPYILMGRATGHSLSRYDWKSLGHPDRPSSRGQARSLKPSEKRKVMDQLGRYASQLSQLRFNKIGSLFEQGDGAFVIGECLSPPFVLQSHEDLESVSRGPFHQERDYYSSLVSTLLAHSEELEMEHHILLAPVPCPEEYSDFATYYSAQQRWNDYAAIGCKADSSQNRLQYSITSMFIRDHVIPLLTEQNEHQISGFPLRHNDLSTQNIFVDDNLNITCILDWALASTIPFAELLATPGLPHPRDLLTDSSLVSAYRSAFEEGHFALQGIQLSPKYWKLGDISSRLMRLVNLDAVQDFHHLDALHRLVFSDSDNISLPTLLYRISTYPEAKSLEHALAADDKPESEVEQQERDYFDAVGPERLALARYISFISTVKTSLTDSVLPVRKRGCKNAPIGPEMRGALAYNIEPDIIAESKSLFVADRRLWQWIDHMNKFPTAKFASPKQVKRQLPPQVTVAQSTQKREAPEIVSQESSMPSPKKARR